MSDVQGQHPDEASAAQPQPGEQAQAAPTPVEGGRPVGARPHDPQAVPAVRIGDRERDAASAALQRHYADGRLTMTELRERLDTVMKATTQRQVDAMLIDLPQLDADGNPVEAPSGARRVLTDPGVRAAVVRWGILSAFFVAVWVATGAGGSFWPIWPILGIGLLKTLPQIARAAGSDGRRP